MKITNLGIMFFFYWKLAPGAYSPEKCTIDHPAAYSFGIKPELKVESIAPAPNQYQPEKCNLEFQPAFSFGGRHNLEKPSQTPAPGAYAPEKCNLEHQPAFSFGGRHDTEKPSQTPGMLNTPSLQSIKCVLLIFFSFNSTRSIFARKMQLRSSSCL